jgi:RimJ/RimL family protein N-acetyltransferase
LLNFSAPGDALYAYYALYHSPERSLLYAHENSAGLTDGFVVVCQTGQRLFQPVVALRTPDARAAVALLHASLVPGRPYYLVTTPDLRDVADEVVQIERAELNHVYELDLSRFEPVLNVLVVPERGSSGTPRFVIRSQGEVASEAGLNWQTPHFAEIYVSTRPAAQGRGWGRSVVSACTQWVVQSGRRPLYIVERGNQASIGLAESLGYTDTGAREYAGDGVCRAEVGR